MLPSLPMNPPDSMMPTSCSQRPAPWSWSKKVITGYGPSLASFQTAGSSRAPVPGARGNTRRHGGLDPTGPVPVGGEHAQAVPRGGKERAVQAQRSGDALLDGRAHVLDRDQLHDLPQ